MSDHRGHTHHIIDAHLAHAARMHVTRHTHDDFVASTGSSGDLATGFEAHAAFQTSSIDALLKGSFAGDLTLDELTAHGDFGLGTVQGLDGELIILDGVCFQVTSDGVVRMPAGSMRTPFAVVCRFAPHVDEPIDASGSLPSLISEIDRIASEHAQDLGPAPILAVRVDGSFSEIDLRSVPGQSEPYPPLSEVVDHQSEWQVIAEPGTSIEGTLLGFRFPPEAQGIEVAGYHLHFLSEDRSVGGHVTGISLLSGRLRLDGATELHLEIPEGVEVAEADTSEETAKAIRAAEGG